MPIASNIILTIGYVFASTLYLVLMLFTLFRDPRSSVHRSYFVFLTGLFLWTATLYLYLYVDLGSALLFWGRLNYTAGVFVASGLTAFFYYFPKKSIRLPAWVEIGYALFSIGMLFICQFTPFIDAKEIMTAAGPEVTLGNRYYLYAFHMLSSVVIAGFFGFRKGFLLSGLDRIRFAYAFWVFIPTCLAAYMQASILPMFGITAQFEYMFLTTVPVAVSSFYAIHHYRFFLFSFLSLRILRVLIMLTGFFSVLTLIDYLMPPMVSTDEKTIVFFIAAVAGVIIMNVLEHIFPELVPKSFREFKTTLQNLTTQLYSCQNFDELQNLIESTFVIGLNIKSAKIYVVCNTPIHVDHMIYYLQDEFTKNLQEHKKVIVLDELSSQKHESALIAKLKEFDAYLCVPLCAETKLIAFMTIGRKNNNQSFSQEEIEEFVKIKLDIEIALMNILINLNLQEENNMMKAILEEKTVDLKEQYQRVHALMKQQSDFIAITAHEFRTPLSIALFQLEDIKESKQLTPELIEDIEVLDTSLQNLSKLVKKLFEVQQYDLDKVKLQKTKINISEFLERIYKSFLHIMEEKHFRFSFHNNLEKNISLKIDEEQLRQVFHNILNNAFKFTPSGKEISITVDAGPNNTVEISVFNEGSSIPDAQKERIFEKFQIKEATLPTGIGLGLYLCKKIVDLHHGKIWVKDVPSKGVVFCVSLPIK